MKSAGVSKFNGHDFSLCEASRYMFEILNISYQDVVDELERILSKQQAHTRAESFTVLEEPHWLTTVGDENKNGHSPIRRSAFALSSKAILSAQAQSSLALNFIFTLAIVDVGLPTCRHQFWIDIDGTLNEFGENGALLSRLHHLASANI